MKNLNSVLILEKKYVGIGIIKTLYKSPPRDAILTIYKSFIRPHLDYCDIVYDHPENDSLTNLNNSDIILH